MIQWEICVSSIFKLLVKKALKLTNLPTHHPSVSIIHSH